MKLNKAIDNLIMLKHFTESEKGENYKDYIEAIDTVLEELNNRIPREYIENILENLNEGQYILNENGEISGRRYEYMAIHYLQKLLNKE